MLSSPARLAVFVSGTGRSLENLIARAGDLPATIELVVANRPCRGEELACEAGIKTKVISGELSEAELSELARVHDLDLIVLAGYLKMIPVPGSLEGRIVNIHPALLPAFGGPGMYGNRVHEAVLESARRGEVTESGCTVHLCDAQYDTGEILIQRKCPVLPTDTPQTLAARVFEEELIAYPLALKSLIRSLPRRSAGS